MGAEAQNAESWRVCAENRIDCGRRRAGETPCTSPRNAHANNWQGACTLQKLEVYSFGCGKCRGESDV